MLTLRRAMIAAAGGMLCMALLFLLRKAHRRGGVLLLFLFLITAGFALFLNTLGFVVTVFLFVSLILFTLENVGILKSMFYGIMFSGFVFLIFSYWMDINFPTGFLGI